MNQDPFARPPGAQPLRSPVPFTTQARADDRSRFGLLACVLAMAGAALLLLMRLGASPLTDVDEGAFSEATREMIVRGDLISPWLLDVPRFDKPALFHWLQMASMAIGGIDADAARLPSAIAGLIWVAAIGCWAWLLSGRNLRAGFWGIAIASTSLAIPVMSRVATADATLNAQLALALLLLWLALTAAQPSSARRWSRLAAVVIAAGLLTKGPIAVLVPGAAFLLSALWSRRAQRLREVLIDPLAWLIVIVLTLPWYLLQYRAQGDAFIAGFFGKHNLGRFTDTMHGFSGGPLYYPVMVIVAMLPWFPLLIRTIVDVLRDRGHPLRARDAAMSWLTGLFVIVFFSFSATKLPHYGFYGLAGLMAFTAVGATVAVRKGSALVPERIVCGLVLLLIVGIHLWWPMVAAKVRDPFYRPAVLELGDRLPDLLPWMIGLAVAGLVALVLARARIGLYAGALCLAVLLHLVLVPEAISSLQEPVRQAGERAARVSGRVVSWELDAPSMSFAARRVIPRAEPVPGDTVVLRADRVERLASKLAAGRPAAQIERVWQGGGLLIVHVVRTPTRSPASLGRRP